MNENKKEIRVGMIGYKFMGKAHSNAYRNLPFFFDSNVVPVMKAISGRNEEQVRKAAQTFGWESYETDWRKLIERDDIDMIDIATPNNMHYEMAIAAAEAGKHIICEKPLAINTRQAKEMYDAARKSGSIHMICHNYRFAPAVQFAKRLIEQNRLGKINHVRGTYLQDVYLDTEAPITWRTRKEITGLGVLGDIGSHSLDLARFLAGEFQEVAALTETFVNQRPAAESNSQNKAEIKQMEDVNVEDAVALIARFENGAIGTCWWKPEW